VKAFSVSLLLGLTVVCARCAGLQSPEPPQQHRAWHPDSAIPTNILSAVEKLYEQGFPDPRLCEYRNIEVAISGVWGGKVSLVKTRGWVLPKKVGTNQFAICWNGLIYPVAKVSAPADLRTEINNTVRLPGMRPGWDWQHSPAAGEQQTIFFTGAGTTRLLLLLRSGEITAALKTWTPFLPRYRFSNGSERVINTNETLIDPYLEFAGDWAWAMFDRTICAHMRGDEVLALATARRLAEVQPKIEAECVRRGFPRQPYYDNQRRGQEWPYLGFLDQLPQILADLERRANKPEKINIVAAGITNYPDQTKRIAALIDDLDLVEARQWSQPGGVNLPEDPVVSALIQEGDPAVEPLLDCADNDKRLTRSVDFSRDFMRDRRVIPVSRAAERAIGSILQARFSDDVSEIHSYWNKYKDLKLEDRWYATLNDDDARERWLEAATNITQPENVRRYPGGFRVEKPAPTNAPACMSGEILRSKSNPSVSELMARRALEVPKDNPNAYDLSSACQMGLNLAKWDARATEPVAKTLIKRCCTVMKYSGQQLGTSVAKLSLACAETGDSHAFDDYANWLATTTPEQLGDSLMACLEPIQKFPTNEVLQSTAEQLFNDTNSAWGKLSWRQTLGDNPIESNLFNIPAFRLLLVRELGKTNVCGSFTCRAPNMVDYQVTNFVGGNSVAGFYRGSDSSGRPLGQNNVLNGSRSVAFPEDEQPASGTRVEIRWCDWVAFSLSNGKHIPFFNPFAPVEKRDEAIEKAKRLLAAVSWKLFHQRLEEHPDECQTLLDVDLLVF
jgi:hypothetical protein